MLAAHALGKGDGRQCLEQREHRPAKERGLLTGHDGNRARIAELRGSRQRLGGRPAPPLLRFEDSGHRVALPGMLLSAGNSGAPRRRLGRVPGKESGHPFVVERVVGRQPPDPGKPSNVDGKSHGGGAVSAARSRAHRCRG